jgi:hypothetical protein
MPPQDEVQDTVSFVISTPEGGKLKRRRAGLASAGRGPRPEVVVEPLAEGRELYLCHLPAPGGDAGSAWRQVADIVGGPAVIAPVMTDSDGNRMYPTGVVQVRFAEPPTEHEARRFGQTYGLKLQSVNKWQPRQAAYTVIAEQPTYLPDTIGRVQQDSAVTRVWPETLSLYKRGV